MQIHVTLYKKQKQNSVWQKKKQRDVQFGQMACFCLLFKSVKLSWYLVPDEYFQVRFVYTWHSLKSDNMKQIW